MRNEDDETGNDDVEKTVEPAEEKLESEKCDSMPALMGPLGSWKELQLKAFLDVVLS